MTESGRGIDDVVRELRGAAGPARATPAPEPGAGKRPGRRRRRHRGRARLLARLAVVSAALLVLAAALVLPGRAPAPDDPRASGPPASWAEVVERLDAARVAAWEAGSLAALAEVDVPGSAADRLDRAAGAALLGAGVRPRGLSLEVTEVGVVSTSARRVVLRVVDRRPAYELVDARDQVVHRVAARDPTAWQVELGRPGEQWRFLEARTLSAG